MKWNTTSQREARTLKMIFQMKRGNINKRNYAWKIERNTQLNEACLGKVFIFSSSVHMFLFRASAWRLYFSALYARAIRKDWEALIQWSSWDNKWGMVCMVQSSEPFSLLTTIDIEIFYNTLRVDVDWNGEETMNEWLELHGRNSKFLHESWLFFLC